MGLVLQGNGFGIGADEDLMGAYNIAHPNGMDADLFLAPLSMAASSAKEGGLFANLPNGFCQH